MRPRRAIRTLLVFVLLGAIATVLTSWLIHGAQWVARDRATGGPLTQWHTGLTPMPAADWAAVRIDAATPLRLHGTFVQSIFTEAQIGHGWLRERHEATSQPGDSTKPGYFNESLTRTTVGWPWPALRCEDYEATHAHGGTGYMVAKTPKASLRGGLVFVSPSRNPFLDRFALPLLPLWPGFLLNTFFYALLLFALIRTPRVLRRAVRRRGGRCDRCGYDRQGLDPDAACPECGVGVRPR